MVFTEIPAPTPRPSFPQRTKKLLRSIICCGHGASRPSQVSVSHQVVDRKRSRPLHVFIAHRGPETKHSVAVLSYEKLMKRGINTFLDFQSMKPGDIMAERIDSALSECQIGVIIFSPGFCESFNSMSELVRLLEMKKTLISVLCDVEPEDLQIPPSDTGDFLYEESRARFRAALEAAKKRVWIPFNTSTGDWSQLTEAITTAVMEKLKVSKNK